MSQYYLHYYRIFGLNGVANEWLWRWCLHFAGILIEERTRRWHIPHLVWYRRRSCTWYSRFHWWMFAASYNEAGKVSLDNFLFTYEMKLKVHYTDFRSTKPTISINWSLLLAAMLSPFREPLMLMFASTATLSRVFLQVRSVHSRRGWLDQWALSMQGHVTLHQPMATFGHW